MKRNNDISSSRRKARKAHFNANSSERRILMSAPLSKDLQEKYGIRRLPIRRGDEVLVVRGRQHDREGKVQTVYRKKWSIYVERITREKANGDSVNVPLKTQNVVITKLKLDRRRKAFIERRAGSREQTLSSRKVFMTDGMED